MRSHRLRILMLAFVALWFGMVLPGHERGVVKLPGLAKAAGQTATDCDAPSAGHSCCPTERGKSDSSRPTDSGHCAICYLIGVLDVPMAISFTLPDAQLLDCLSPAMRQSIAAVAVLDVTRDRGPPLV